MLHDVRKQGIQGYKIECVTIAPICTDLMDLSGRISFQCCALLVYHCAFFRYVSPKKIRNSLRAASSSKCLLALLCIFVFYLFLHLIILSFFSSFFFVFLFQRDHVSLLLGQETHKWTYLKTCQKGDFILCNVKLFYYCSKVQATCCAMTECFLGSFQREPVVMSLRPVNQSSTDRFHFPFTNRAAIAIAVIIY